MKLNIPCSPFEINVTVARKPDTPWGRLGLRGLMILVAIAAFCAWLAPGILDRYAGSRSAKTYSVGDLIAPGAVVSAELPRLAATLKSAVGRDLWSSRDREIIPFFLSQSLIIRDTEAGHKRVEAWLQQQRSRLPGVKKSP
jgi:hypothetical protein